MPKRKNNSTRVTDRGFWILFVSGIGLDRITKIYASETLRSRDIPILGDFFRFHLVHNEGVAFSMPITGVFLKILTVGLLGALAYYFSRMETYRHVRSVALAYAGIFAGGAANAFERLFMGRVTDFLDLKHFAIFNVADIMVTCSAAYVLAFHFFHDRHRKPD